MKRTVWFEIGRKMSDQNFDKFLTEVGLPRSLIDSCCYSQSDLRGNRIIICVCVDDITYFSTSSDLADSFRKSFCAKFRIEEKGLMKRFFDVSVEQSPGEITFSQKSYNSNFLSCFGMSDCNH